ncbi:4-coumarate--CoA ligase-like 5 [Nicotiana sylvestris]|uniref:4-coumarate--CoA ligase-like 5 n=1 Tax=Nicotiana sylvestris TaxID=4096 RepID=UPI00388C79AD
MEVMLEINKKHQPLLIQKAKRTDKAQGISGTPAELEQLLQSIPEIADAAVIPYPDEEAGQIPMAYVVRKPGSTISESQIVDSIAKQVAPYKKIRRVAFINSIPRSPAGKILRRELIDQAISGTSARL